MDGNDSFDINRLKSLLDNSIQDVASQGDAASSDTDLNNKESPYNLKNQINLSNLYQLLVDLINGQRVLVESVSDSNFRLDSIESNVSILDDNLRKVEKWTEIGERKKGTSVATATSGGEVDPDSTTTTPAQIPEDPKPRDSSSSRASSRLSKSLDRKPLPPIANSSADLLNARSSVLIKAAQSRMNYADKYDVKKLATRIDILSKKVEKLSEVVPENEKIISQMSLISQENEDGGGPAQEAWSKLMLTKRIDANEESLEKFMQLLDKLASDIEDAKDQISKLGSQFEEISSQVSDLNDNLDKVARDAKAVAGKGDTEGLASEIKAQKDAINKAIKDIKDLLNRLKALESAVENTISGKDLDKVSDRFKKLSDAANNRIDGLEDQLTNLDAMTTSLGKQFKNMERRASLTTEDCGHPPEPIPAGPDMETIKNLSEMRSRLSRLEPRVEDLESTTKELQDIKPSDDSIFDQDAFKLQIMSEMPGVIEQYLEDINSRILNLEKDNEKLNEIVNFKLNNNPIETEKIDLSGLADKEYLNQLLGEKSDYFKKLNDQVNEQIKQLHDTIAENGKVLWADIEKIKGQIDTYESDLNDLRKRLLESSNGMFQGVQDATLSNVNTMSPHISALLEKLQKKCYNLEESFNDQVNKLTIVETKGNERSRLIDELACRISDLEISKADKSKIEEALDTKANKADLASTVRRDNFDLVMHDVNDQMDNLLKKMVDLEGNYKDNLMDISHILGEKMDKKDMDPFRTHLESRLKSLKALLEKTGPNDREGEESHDPSIYRKPLLGYRCITCDKKVYPMLGEPVASIPASGFMPGLSTLRPYTTFELHNIRAHSRRFNHTHRTHGYGDGNTIHDLTQPSNVQVGRSCGGNHTLTAPHRRYTHLKQLSELWNPSNIIDDDTYHSKLPQTSGNVGSGSGNAQKNQQDGNKYNEYNIERNIRTIKKETPSSGGGGAESLNQRGTTSGSGKGSRGTSRPSSAVHKKSNPISVMSDGSRKEVELMGNDGHIYKGREKKS